MSLTEAQMIARDGRLTASQVGILMKGDPQAIYDLWRMHTGDPSYREHDLSDIWPVQLGSETEALNLRWYAHRTGNIVIRQGEVVYKADTPWAAATLDGWDETLDCPIECKHVGNWRKLEDIVTDYYPQLHWQMLVTDTSTAILSVIIGASEPVLRPVPFDRDYALELWARAVAYWQCVETMTPPIGFAPVAASIPQEDWIEIDMTGSNAWAEHAWIWISNKSSAKQFEEAAKGLKELIAPECGRAFGHGIEIKKSKNNALTIKELKS